MKYLFLFLAFCFLLPMEGQDVYWENSYHTLLLEKVGKKIPEFSNYPSLQFPNEESEELCALFPDSKVLVFAYGSLINRASASRTIKPEAVKTMEPALAFGAKRVFNYQTDKTAHWGECQNKKEKAMLNLTPVLGMNSLVNGVVVQVDAEDLRNLVAREKGYDLVPVPIVLWEDAVLQNPRAEVKIAYTFIAPNEPRDHIKYTSTQFYPVRGYLHAVQEGSREWGQEFLDFWNNTTYLADGTMILNNWDEETFTGILCTKEAAQSTS